MRGEIRELCIAKPQRQHSENSRLNGEQRCCIVWDHAARNLCSDLVHGAVSLLPTFLNYAVVNGEQKPSKRAKNCDPTSTRPQSPPRQPEQRRHHQERASHVAKVVRLTDTELDTGKGASHAFKDRK